MAVALVDCGIGGEEVKVALAWVKKKVPSQSHMKTPWALSRTSGRGA
jgi:hypothetical protein